MKNRRNIVEQQNPPQNPNDIWLKDGKFYRSTSEGWTIIDSELEYTNKETMIADNPKGGTIGIDKESGEPSIYNDVTKQWSPLGGGVTETTWQELKDKRDNGQLIPGSLYRITDYQCTTTQENTQSAGHQFDIVLLALSENKLAEEGWAMEHPTDVYDVTFGDGVTLKCYLYFFDDETDCNIVLVADTSIGHNLGVGKEDLYNDGIIDEENKTLFEEGLTSNDFLTKGKPLPYNYFQNSNLSAWKIWYCLDNDKSRFAWADNTYKLGPSSIICDCYRVNTKVDGPIDMYGKQFVNGAIYYRDEEKDTTIPFMGHVPAYAWTSENNITIFTTSVSPNSSSTTYTYSTGGGLSKINGGDHILYLTTSYVEGLPNYDFPNGRGVIYRLIDEWNNDCPYDFKNIQFIRKLNGGELDAQGTNIYCYTFTLYDRGNHEYKDASIFAINYKNDETGVRSCYDNKIETNDAYTSISDYYNKYSLVLPNIICIAEVETGEKCWAIYKNKMKGHTLSISGDSSFNNIYSNNSEYTDVIGTIIAFNKKAVFENI